MSLAIITIGATLATALPSRGNGTVTLAEVLATSQTVPDIRDRSNNALLTPCSIPWNDHGFSAQPACDFSGVMASSGALVARVPAPSPPWSPVLPRLTQGTNHAAAVPSSPVLAEAGQGAIHAAPVTGDLRTRFLRALEEVEDSQKRAGDHGKAIGPYQIHYQYWQCAVRSNPALRVPEGYRACRTRAYSRRVVAAYLAHYAPEAWQSGDWVTLARIHNGGPSGYKKHQTLDYALRVLNCIRSG